MAPAGAGERDPEETKAKREKEAAKNPRVTGGSRRVQLQGNLDPGGDGEGAAGWRARSPGHRAPSARAVRSLQAQACPDANQHE